MVLDFLLPIGYCFIVPQIRFTPLPLYCVKERVPCLKFEDVIEWSRRTEYGLELWFLESRRDELAAQAKTDKNAEARLKAYLLELEKWNATHREQWEDFVKLAREGDRIYWYDSRKFFPIRPPTSGSHGFALVRESVVVAYQMRGLFRGLKS